MQRVKELSINSINGAMSSADMEVFADEVGHLRQELLDAANGMVDGKYIFSGYQENIKPFVPNPNYNPNPPTDPLNLNPPYDPADSSTWPYIYQGDPNPTELEITPGERLQTNLTGNDLFMGISNNIMQAGPIPPAVGYPSDAGRVDIFSVLTRLEEALRAGNINDPAGPGGGVQAQMDDLDLAADQNRRLRSQLGNKANRVETAMVHQQDIRIDLHLILSRYQDADAIETFAEISKQETAFQAALSITAKISKISILDYL
jgi:flagellar hook-associated protein 3 FlgL